MLPQSAHATAMIIENKIASIYDPNGRKSKEISKKLALAKVTKPNLKLMEFMDIDEYTHNFSSNSFGWCLDLSLKFLMANFDNINHEKIVKYSRLF